MTTLIEEFRYPRLGPGQMWEALRRSVEHRGDPGRAQHRCMRSATTDDRVARASSCSTNGDASRASGRRVSPASRSASSCCGLDPPRRRRSRRGRERLRYRRLCLVALMTTEEEPFPDNWIYLHDPGTRPAACRTSAPGAPTWSSPGRPASASSTSASRATNLGGCPTRRRSSSRRTSWPGSG